jgi:hypothetical protein
MESEMVWWGYSKEHGWVVLDRSIPGNGPGLKGDLVFLRCRDSTSYAEKRASWEPPLYRFAPNYISSLKAPASEEAAAEFEAFKALWPEFQLQIQREQREIEDRAEAARREEEQQHKLAVREKKKQAAAAAAAAH